MILFFYKDLPPNMTGLPLQLAGYTGEIVHHAPRGNAYKTLHVLLTSTVTAGSATVQAYKNSVASGDPVVLDNDAHRGSKAIDLSVEPGDLIQVKVATPANFTPASTEDLIALLT